MLSATARLVRVALFREPFLRPPVLMPSAIGVYLEGSRSILDRYALGPVASNLMACNNIIEGTIAVPMLDGRYASPQGLLEELVERTRNFDRIVTHFGSKQFPPHQSVDFRFQY